MLTSSDDPIERFAGYVGLAALDRPFISKSEERSLLADGIAKFNLTAEQARGILLSVAQTGGIPVERDVDARILSVLERYGGSPEKAEPQTLWRGGGDLPRHDRRHPAGSGGAASG